MNKQTHMGNAVRKAAIDAELSHAQLAEKIGISATYMSTLVNKAHFNTKLAERIAEACGITLSKLTAMAEPAE